MSRAYRPSNGTEGEVFMEDWCFRCTKNANQDCPIIGASLAFDLEDANYPSQLVYDAKGKPCCTAFEDVEDAKRRAETNAILGIVRTEVHPDQMDLF
jgi:hypothetical protein